MNAREAALVRRIFERFVTLGSATALTAELRRTDTRNKQGKPIDKGYLYRELSNRVYLGEAMHKGESHPGEHDAIVGRTLWDKVHGILKESPRSRASRHRGESPAILRGLLFGPGGVAMTPSHTRKRGRLYRYYVATETLRIGPTACPIRRVPAAEIETAVVAQVRVLVASPEIIVATWRAIRANLKGITEREVRERLTEFTALWDELFPAEQARIVRLLVARVDLDLTGADITLHTEGLTALADDLLTGDGGAAA